MDTISGFSLESLPPEHLQFLLYALGAAGLLYCFAGYRLFRFVLGLTGFLIAGAVAGVLSGWFSAGDVAVMLICGIFGGFCGALAMTFMYRLGIFGLGCVAAVLVSRQLALDFIDAPHWFVVLGAGALGGVVALVLERPALTLATAVIGAWLSVFSAYLIVVGVEVEGLAEVGETLAASPQLVLLLLAAWLGLVLIGASVQFGMTKKKEA